MNITLTRTLVGVGALGLTALVYVGPASADTAYCAQTTPSNSILFYNKDTGSTGTGTLTAGHWSQQALTQLPTGYSHAAASRDTLVLYNTDTGAVEVGHFVDGIYTRVESGYGATGWTHVEATGDSVLFYDATTGRAASGTLEGGVYREIRAYDNFSPGWSSIAGSCNLMTFVKNIGHGDLPDYQMSYGSLEDGVYTDHGELGRVLANDLTAVADTFLLRQASYSGDFYQLTWESGLGGLTYQTDLSDGTLGGAPIIGTSGHWDLIGRTGDSLFFYNTDGTAWTSTLSGGTYANVGPLANVSSGWTTIEGGV